MSTLSQIGKKLLRELQGLVRLRPRLGFGLALALLSLLWVQGVWGVSASGVVAEKSTPATVISVVEHQASLVYARAARLVSDFRLVYEVHSQLHGPAPGEEAAAVSGRSYPDRPEATTTCSLASKLGLT
jgi:hypothetical protein